MTLKTVGIISAGEMGSGFGTVLTQHGLRVLTVLEGRGAATRERAAKAGMHDAGDFDTLVQRVGDLPVDPAARRGAGAGGADRGGGAPHGRRTAVRGLQCHRAGDGPRRGGDCHVLGRALRGRGHHRSAADATRAVASSPPGLARPS